MIALNMAWKVDLGNGDEHLADVRRFEAARGRGGYPFTPLRALYEVTPDGATVMQRSPVLYPAGALEAHELRKIDGPMPGRTSFNCSCGTWLADERVAAEHRAERGESL